jgi:hypothetical protein
MLGTFRNAIFKQTEDLDLGLTPWKLSLISSKHPLEVFLYFKTHEEAKDHEDICVTKGWTTLGVMWHD